MPASGARVMKSCTNCGQRQSLRILLYSEACFSIQCSTLNLVNSASRCTLLQFELGGQRVWMFSALGVAPSHENFLEKLRSTPYVFEPQ
mmetsp:Transcript_46182/g.86228  ORF Transcript_46182/g.86228 Transcript_46182/m.86228 type:complete len:89 (+) Transcript_46182:2-268(+)